MKTNYKTEIDRLPKQEHTNADCKVEYDRKVVYFLKDEKQSIEIIEDNSSKIINASSFAIKQLRQ